MKNIALFALVFLFGCSRYATVNTPFDVSEWAYIDDIKVSRIDIAYDYVSRTSMPFGLYGKDTIWAISTSNIREYYVNPKGLFVKINGKNYTYATAK